MFISGFVPTRMGHGADGKTVKRLFNMSRRYSDRILIWKEMPDHSKCILASIKKNCIGCLFMIR